MKTLPIMKTVYITIGNSDDRLLQREWSAFVHEVSQLVRSLVGGTVHGKWLSEPSSAWQNACWCVTFAERDEETLRDHLRMLAWQYRQYQIAYATVGPVEFLKGIEVT